MAWYNEVQWRSSIFSRSDQRKSFRALTKRVGGGKNLRKGQFSHVFGQRAGALSVFGAASGAVCEVSPEKVSSLVLDLRTQKYSAVMY